MKTITATNPTELAQAVVSLSGYELAELKADFKPKASQSWKRGFWASRGIDYGFGVLIVSKLF
jgi:hypothetical protein